MLRQWGAGRTTSGHRQKKAARQRKSVVTERGLSDSFPWQDDKTVRNAAERGKRSDQELKNEKRGEK